MFISNVSFKWLLWIAVIITVIINTEQEMVFGVWTRIRGDIACRPPHPNQAAIPALCLFNLSINSFLWQGRIYINATLSNQVFSHKYLIFVDPFDFHSWSLLSNWCSLLSNIWYLIQFLLCQFVFSTALWAVP